MREEEKELICADFDTETTLGYTHGDKAEALNVAIYELENKEEIEKIEEIGTTARNTLFTMECFTGIPEKAQDWNFNILKEKINELVKAVNKLNEEDTSKETNCMTD